MNITFGTSGHRGIMGTDFTVSHVKAIALAVAQLLRKETSSPQVAIGYDPRKGNSITREEGSYTQVLVDTLLSAGIHVDFFDHYTPTPLVSWHIKKTSCSGGFILTASHNPADYNGLKFNPKNGAPAPASVTQQIEHLANLALTDQPIGSTHMGQLHLINKDVEFATDLLKTTASLLDLSSIDLSSFSLVIDAKHGAVGQVWKELLSQTGLTHYDILHQDPRSDFGHDDPNPTKYDTLASLISRSKELNASMAIANDPDGDRHVILDEQSQPLLPEETGLIILDYLLEQDTCSLSHVVTTVASSRQLKLAAQKHQLTFHETPVGFKYFAPFFQDAINTNGIAIGIESSGGMSISSHTLEKCGFIPGIILLSIIKETGLSLSQLKHRIESRYGKTSFMEKEFHFSPHQKPLLMDTFNKATTDDLAPHFDQPLESLLRTDGLKLLFKSTDWLLFRFSGTEPIARIYCESNNDETSHTLITQAQQFLASLI